MPTPKQTIAGFLIATAGVIGSMWYATSAEAPTLEPDQIIIEVKSELADIPEEIVVKGGLTYSVKYLKTYKSQDGAVSDTPKSGYVIVTDTDEMITQTTIVETEAEKTARLEANSEVEATNKIKSDNETLYRQIGEIETIKLGKQSAGTDTAKEDSDIQLLKDKLQ